MNPNKNIFDKNRKLAKWEIKWRKQLREIPEWIYPDNPFACHCHKGNSHPRCQMTCQIHPL